MKTFFAAALIALSASAFAMPKVGDSATYTGTANGVTLEVVSALTAADEARGVFTRTDTTKYMGQSSVESEEVKAEDLMDEDSLKQVVEYCALAGIGANETVTVPAGTFNTCKIVSDDGSIINIGVVPFGVVKMSNAQITMELASFVVAP